MDRCYFCAVRFKDGETRIAIGNGEEVHAVPKRGKELSCYENYLAFLSYIARPEKSLSDSMRRKDAKRATVR